MSDSPAEESSWPKISQNMSVGRDIAVIPVPFFVHFNKPRLESIDFSHEGSLSTSHRGILFLSCTCDVKPLVNLLFVIGF
jgi:hypothetical protein